MFIISGVFLWMSVPNAKKGGSMKQASGKKSIVVWSVEVGKGRSRKRSPKALKQRVTRKPNRVPYFVLQLTIKETRVLKSTGSRSQIVILKEDFS